MVQWLKRALRLVREGIFRTLIGLASGFAAGCLAVVVTGLPFFAAETLMGWTVPGPIVGLLMLAAGALAAIVAFLHVFRGITVAAAAARPRRSLRQRLNAIPWFRQPPWVVPDRIAEDSPEGQALKQRLVDINSQGAHYRDRHTGQLWQAVYWEQGFGSGYDLVPVTTSTPHVPDERRGDRDMPWERPGIVFATPGGRLGERLFERLDRIAPDPAFLADPESGLFRDRLTGQHWRSVVSFGEMGDDGHVLMPVLPPTPESEPGKQTS